MTDMSGPVLAAFQSEVTAFSAALSGLPAALWNRPTRCAPWQVRDVVGHVITVLARVPDMVTASAPPQPDTDPITYYRADARFSETVNAERVQSARSRATVSGIAGLVNDLADVAQEVVALCARQPAGRVVRTRHGDAMLLSDFLLTRLFETAVHGIDIADAVDQPAWLTTHAAHHLGYMLFGTNRRTATNMLGGDAGIALRKATGRAPVTPNELTLLNEWGAHRLALG